MCNLFRKTGLMLPEPPSFTQKSIISNQKLTIMKRIAFTLGLLFTFQFALLAQDTDTEVVVFNAHLLETFNLNVDGIEQEITFDDADDYNLGVTEAEGIAPGFTLISVEATGNWDLTITAPDFQPYVGPNGAGTGIIPIENLGVWVEATGAHQFGGEVTCAFQVADDALGLTDNVADPALLIGLGSGNAGDISDNAFTLHWLMGTMQGSMESTVTMFDQLSAGVFGPGVFTTTATLTLTEIP